MIPFLDLHGQYLSIKDEIDEAVERVFSTASFIGGPMVREFEEAFAAYQHARYCIGVGNGTDALEIAIQALDLPPGSEIIVPANSFIASSEAVTRSGHRVVFADVDPESYLMSAETVSAAITPRTAAVMAVHLYGRPCDMDSLREIADTHGLRLIEDAAQAHGAEWSGQRVGALGDVGTFSFYPGKNLGAYGDGGAVVTNDENLANRVRSIANHGRIEKYTHEFEGRNSRLDTLQAAILTVKLRHLDEWIDRRNAVARRYLVGLCDVPPIILPRLAPGSGRHAFHLFVVQTKVRADLEVQLRTAGVATGRHYPLSLPKQPAYRHHGDPDLTMWANQVDENLLSLPIGEHVSDADVDFVVRTIRSFHDVP